MRIIFCERAALDSEAVLARLMSERRRIIQSLPPIHPPVHHEKF